MMFEPTSRYAHIEMATRTLSDGRIVRYLRRRFVPNGTTMPVFVEVTIAQGDRIDVITAKTLGDPEQFWRVCDANQAMHPEEITDRIGTTVRVPIPQP